MSTVYGANQIKLELNWRWNGVSAVNVLWFQKNVSPVELGDLQAVAEEATDTFWTAYRARASNQCILETAVATDWTAPDGQQITNADGRTGVLATGSVPNNVALVVSFRANRVGRSNRGRMYAPGIGEEEVTGNTPSTNLKTALFDGVVNMALNLLSQGIVHVISSSFTNGAPRTIRNNIPVTQWLIDDRVDTQRRRLPRGFSN